MTRRETRSVVVTGAFVALVMALIAGGVATGNPGLDLVAAAEVEQNVPDAQFVEYLAYRARLESSSNCQ